MNTGIPLYEGDGHFHRPATPSLLQDGATARATKRTPLTTEALVSIELQARRLRAATIQTIGSRHHTSSNHSSGKCSSNSRRSRTKWARAIMIISNMIVVPTSHG